MSSAGEARPGQLACVMSWRTRSRKWLSSTPAAVAAASSRLSVKTIVRPSGGVVADRSRRRGRARSGRRARCRSVCARMGMRTMPRKNMFGCRVRVRARRSADSAPGSAGTRQLSSGRAATREHRAGRLARAMPAARRPSAGSKLARRRSGTRCRAPRGRVPQARHRADEVAGPVPHVLVALRALRRAGRSAARGERRQRAEVPLVVARLARRSALSAKPPSETSPHWKQ